MPATREQSDPPPAQRPRVDEPEASIRRQPSAHEQSMRILERPVLHIGQIDIIVEAPAAPPAKPAAEHFGANLTGRRFLRRL